MLNTRKVTDESCTVEFWMTPFALYEDVGSKAVVNGVDLAEFEEHDTDVDFHLNIDIILNFRQAPINAQQRFSR